MSGKSGRLQRWIEESESQGKVGNAVKEWPTWPQPPEGGVAKTVAVILGLFAVLMAIIWGLAYAMRPDAPTCGGETMSRTDTCEFTRGGVAQSTSNYQDMLGIPSHPVAYTFTVLIVMAFGGAVWSVVRESVKSRPPTSHERAVFIDRYRAARAELEAALSNDPLNSDARRDLAALDTAAGEVGELNGFSVRDA